MSDHVFLSAMEAANFLGLKPKTLYDWVRKEKIKHYKVGGKLCFLKSDLEEYLSTCLRQPRLHF